MVNYGMNLKNLSTFLKRHQARLGRPGWAVLRLLVNSTVAVATSAAPLAVAAQWVNQESMASLVDQANLPAGAKVQVDLVREESRLNDDSCPAPLFSKPPANKMWGRTFLQVQCVGSTVQPFFVPVDVKVWAPVMVVRNLVQSGQAVQAGDIELRTMDITQLNHGWMTDIEHLQGKTATRQLWPGTQLRHDHLRGQALVRRGDAVRVMISGPGFAIGGQGTAMEEAELGQIVRIKTEQGKVLHGVAVDALVVEVTL